MVTEKLHILTFPTLSVAEHVTVVDPNGNVLGVRIEAAGLHDTLATPLPSVAVTVGLYPVSVTVGVTPFVGDPT